MMKEWSKYPNRASLGGFGLGRITTAVEPFSVGAEWVISGCIVQPSPDRTRFLLCLSMQTSIFFPEEVQ